jgi:hypothetical protein
MLSICTKEVRHKVLPSHHNTKLTTQAKSILYKTAMFELSHQVATGKEQAKQLFTNLKTLQQRLEDTGTDATILQDLNICVANAQEISTVAFLFIEKEAEKYVFLTFSCS